MPLPFFKYHGCGNDFVLLHDPPCTSDELRQLVPHLADRHRGIGGDQVLVLRAVAAPDAIGLEIFNADGSAASMCGNGLRCVALHASSHLGMTCSALTVHIGLASYLVVIERDSRGIFQRASVQMGAPQLHAGKIPMVGLAPDAPTINIPIPKPVQDMLPAQWEEAGMEASCTCVSMGNPHVVFFGAALPHAWLREVGARVERASCFPMRCNVHFAHVESGDCISMVTWERGAGATLACGSGACAVLVAAVAGGRVLAGARIAMPGGSVHVSWPGGSGSVQLTGPAALTFQGVWPRHHDRGVPMADTSA